MSLVSFNPEEFISRALVNEEPQCVVEALMQKGFTQYEAWDSVIEIGKRPIILSECPSIILYPQFVSDSECEELIRLARYNLTDSLTYDVAEDGVDGGNRQYRNSQSCRVCEPSVIPLALRIGALLDIPRLRMESYEVVKYTAGGFFGDHYDWYDSSPGGKRQLGATGNRVATAIMYLNTPDGGSTYFPNLDITVRATKGSMLVFKYPNCEESTLHRGCDVLSGDKWVATKFVRTYDFEAS